MLILRDFKCSECGKEFEDLTEGPESDCYYCGALARMVIKKVTVHGCEFFYEHYDEQIGQYFESADHKKKTLKKMGFVQTEGPLSPKKSNNTSIQMTHGQAKKFDSQMVHRRPKED